MGACRVVGGGGKESGPAVSVKVSVPLFAVVPDSGGGISSRGKVVADAVVCESCVANSVPGDRLLSLSWSWRMTTCAGMSKAPSARALLDLMICSICLVGFLPCSCRL